LGVDLPDPDLFYTMGIPMPPTPEVPQLYIAKKMKKIRHVMGSDVGVLFSDTARAIIEDIEPDVHAFYPVNVEGREERGFTEEYHILHVRSRLKAIARDVPESQKFFVLWDYNPKYRHENFSDYYFSIKYGQLALQNNPPNIFVKKSVVEGRALWAEYGLPGKYCEFFACDEFVRRLGKSGFGGRSPDVKVGVVE